MDSVDIVVAKIPKKIVYRNYPFFRQRIGSESGSFTSLIGGKPDESADQLLKY